MYFCDFEYDSVRLSDLGYMVCSFDSGGLETVSNGCELTFNTIPSRYGEIMELTSREYESRIEATFWICKDPEENTDTMYFAPDEVRNIMRWLNRKGFHEFRILEDDFYEFIYVGSFNVSRKEVGSKVIGFELTFISNSPFARVGTVEWKIDASKGNVTKRILNESDEEGITYPKMVIDILRDGDLRISNLTENRTTVITGCHSGETIIMNYPMIESTDQSHKIMNCFNWKFFRLV